GCGHLESAGQPMTEHKQLYRRYAALVIKDPEALLSSSQVSEPSSSSNAQNSLPSGSASTYQPISSSLARSTVAPTSSSDCRSATLTSQWMRFLTVFGSGTLLKSMVRIGIRAIFSTVAQPLGLTSTGAS